MLLLILAFFGTSPIKTTPPTISSEDLSRGVKQIMAERSYRGASWGVCIQAPLRDNETLFQFRSTADLRPASTLKVLTSLAAFEYLGPDYVFQTRVTRTGTMEHGVVKGDLVVHGGGDPSFSGRYGQGWKTSDLLRQWVQRIGQAGVRRVEGNLLADLSFFDDETIQSSWNRHDVGGEYAVPVTALSINDGLFEIGLEPNTRRDHRWIVWPLGQNDVQVIDQTTGLAKKGRRYGPGLQRNWGTNQFTARGQVASCRSYAWTYAAWDPALLYMQALHYELERQGIIIGGKLGRFNPSPNDKLHHVATWESDRLASLSKVLMKVSQNHYADCFLKTLGYEVNGIGSFEAGARVANQLLTDIAPSPELVGDQSIVDGSGLSHLNRLSSGQLVALLNHGLKAKYRDDWMANFPLMGIDGTLKRRGNTRTKGYVWAKTGFINRTRALAGYVETLAGEPLIFSIIVNDYRCSTGQVEVAQDRICNLMRQLTPTKEVYEKREQRYYLSGLPMPSLEASKHTLGGSR